jgi:hypothetical protein
VRNLIVRAPVLVLVVLPSCPGSFDGSCLLFFPHHFLYMHTVPSGGHDRGGDGGLSRYIPIFQTFCVLGERRTLGGYYCCPSADFGFLFFSKSTATHPPQCNLFTNAKWVSRDFALYTADRLSAKVCSLHMKDVKRETNQIKLNRCLQSGGKGNTVV